MTDDRALSWPEKTKMIMLESAVNSNKDLATEDDAVVEAMVKAMGRKMMM